MDTLCSNIDRATYSTKDNIEFADGLKNYTKLVLSNYTDKTIINFEKFAITNINKEIRCNKNNNYFNGVSNPIECKNNKVIYQNNDAIENDNQIINCSKRTLNTLDTSIIMHNKQNVLLRFSNKKQQNISFSKEKLWEMNRVNQILHKKISSGIKSTYVIRSPTVLMKATATINREKKKKDIIKENNVLAKKLSSVKSTISK